MKKLLTEAFRTSITRNQCRDTGMAMVLLLLILSLAFKRERFVLMAILALVVNMTGPQLYRPVAIIWLGLAHLIGSLVSKILLSVVFFALVTPVGLARRLLGKDLMQLRSFKASGDSVMVDRNHLFTAQDIEKPY